MIKKRIRVKKCHAPSKFQLRLGNERYNFNMICIFSDEQKVCFIELTSSLLKLFLFDNEKGPRGFAWCVRRD